MRSMNILIRNDEWDILSSEKRREFLSKIVNSNLKRYTLKIFAAIVNTARHTDGHILAH